MTNWMVLMADPLHRGAFEAGLAAVFMFLAYWFNEKVGKKIIFEGGRVFLAPMAAAAGMPIAAILAAIIPGVDAKELVAAMFVGGLGTHGVHALGNKVAGKPPTNPPGSPGDGDSIEGGK